MKSRSVLPFNLMIILLMAICLRVSSVEGLSGIKRKTLRDGTDADAMVKLHSVSTQDDENRIFNGKTIGWESIPFMVGIRESRQGANVCGGTLLTSRLVLTAGHCVAEARIRNGKYAGFVPIKGLYVSIGNSEKTGADSGELIEVSRVKVHPYFEQNDGRSISEYDAGIIVLRHNVSQRYRHFVDYDTIRSYRESHLLWRMSRADAYGWGAVESSWRGTDDFISHSYPNQLQHTRLTFQPKKACQSWFTSPIHFEYLCAGKGTWKSHEKPQKGICKGDSGGPLMYDGRQIGISVATGEMCGTAPGIFLRVSYIYAWIEYVINEDAKRQDFLAG